MARSTQVGIRAWAAAGKAARQADGESPKARPKLVV
jgi:hypothetical protein